MSEIEWRTITGDSSHEELILDIENIVQQHRENKYAFQVGLKDLDFDVNEDLLLALDLRLPFQSIGQAEQALRGKAITPISFLEHDLTEHQVLAFDHRPVGFSGFMDCVTHSLALTDHGLFEVGRYPAMNLSSTSRYWQWFLHRHLATPDEINSWCESQELSAEQFLEKAYHALISG